MSSLALTSAASSGVADRAVRKIRCRQLLPGPLSTHREFPQADEVALFAEVYDNSADRPHKVNIRASLKAEGGQIGLPDERGA